MKVWLVTWEGDLTQFLTMAENASEAVRLSMESNERFHTENWGADELYEDVSSPETYTAELVSLDMLFDILERTDKIGVYSGCYVFNG